MRCAIMWTLPVTPSGLQVVWVCHCGGRRGGKGKESPHSYTVAWFGLRARAGTVEEPPLTSPSQPLPELLLLLLLTSTRCTRHSWVLGIFSFSWLCHVSGSVNTGNLLGLGFPISKMGIMNAATSPDSKK